MNDTLKDITGYIDFLRKHGWCVMLSCFGNNFGDCLPVLLEYEVHQPNVCVYLKSNPSMRGKCIHNKRMLEKNPRRKCTIRIATPELRNTFILLYMKEK